MRFKYKLIIGIFLITLLWYFSNTRFNSINKNDWSKEKVIEGIVSNYEPMDIEGHGSMEIFKVDSLFFTYSDYISTGFYNNSCVNGGLICKNGQKVRIKYKTQHEVINGIVKIEILN